jgi:WD40 repeat protein
MRILSGHKYPVGKLRFSPNGRWLLAAADSLWAEPMNRGAVRLWDLPAGTSRELAHAVHAEFTPDSRSLLYKDGPRGRRKSLQLADLASGTSAPLSVVGREVGDFGHPRFSPDGSLLVSASDRRWGMGRAIQLNWTRFPGWESAGEWRLEIPVNPSDVTSVVCGWFVDVAFSPDGQTLAGLCAAGVILFDVKSGKQMHVQRVTPKQGKGFLAYHPSGRQLVFGSGTEVVVFDPGTWTEITTLRQSRKYFHSGAFTPDGRQFLTVSNEATVKCWDTARWAAVREYAWQIGGLASVAVAPDGMTAAAGSAKKKVVVWDLDD